MVQEEDGARQGPVIQDLVSQGKELEFYSVVWSC